MRAIAGVLLVAAAPGLAALAGGAAEAHWSTIPDGPYGALPPEARLFEASDGTLVSYGLFRPDAPAHVRAPLLVVASPYFSNLYAPVNVADPATITAFLVDNYVSHGYAVVTVSVRGTGWSGGCMELLSVREGLDVSELVTHLAREPWANGRAAMLGVSYDGATPWRVASLGNPHLATIVPISGWPDLRTLLVHEGVSELRGPVWHAGLYYPFGFGVAATLNGISVDEDRALLDRAANANCPDAAAGAAAAGVAAATGGDAPVLDAYWRERDARPGVLANYTGSVFLVHGLFDWNVDPHNAVPFFDELPQRKKMWLGQWSHATPDATRRDWAAVLKTWLDRELTGADVDTGPAVEVQDGSTRRWRSAAAWPPPDAPRARFHLTGDGRLADEPESFRLLVASPAGAPAGGLAPCVENAPRAPGVAVRAVTFHGSAAGGILASGFPVATLTLESSTGAPLAAVLCRADGGAVTHGVVRPPVSAGPVTVDLRLEPIERTFAPGEDLMLRLSSGTFYPDGGYGGEAYAPHAASGAVVVTRGTFDLPLR